MFNAIKQRLNGGVSYSPLPLVTSLPDWQAALKQKDLAQLDELLNGMSCAERYPAWLTLAKLPNKTLRQWYNDAGHAAIALAVQLFEQAMTIRGDGFPEQVDTKIWNRFFALTDEAQGWLEQFNPGADNIFFSDWQSWMMLTQLTHAEGVHAMHACRVAASKHCPDNFVADRHYFLAMSRRFGGDNEQMFQFARQVLKPALGASQHSLLAFAYNELAATLRVDKGLEASQRYMQRPVFVDELSESFRKWLGTKELSVANIQQRAHTPMGVWQLNEYALAFAQIGEETLLPRILQAIDGNLIGLSWQRLAMNKSEAKQPRKHYQRLLTQVKSG
ncbi:hypothetical protein [Salinibius halmophilus]|uniref:hypothetical protein n=1 Tax=Salinibius halmophilus TaxID=1853216 RepID=UPI000E672E01|nr:hypothetical protein [Salinibius halmophilus]